MTAAPSLAQMEAELGPENAQNLAVRIGVLAQAQLGSTGASIESTVDRVLSSLTDAERKTMAAGGTPPRVMELIGAEAECGFR